MVFSGGLLGWWGAVCRLARTGRQAELKRPERRKEVRHPTCILSLVPILGFLKERKEKIPLYVCLFIPFLFFKGERFWGGGRDNCILY